jgi:hypothetical protein
MTSPEQMQQMLAMYRQQFPNGQPSPQQQQLQGLNQVGQGLQAPLPMGANRTAGGINGASQLIVALMKAQKMKQIQQQLNAGQTANPPAASPQDFTANTDMGAASGPQ